MTTAGFVAAVGAGAAVGATVGAAAEELITDDSDLVSENIPLFR